MRPCVRSGLEIAAPEGTSVRAVHGGTVGYAEGYTGLGTLVILDHGDNNFSLYGYLLSLSVQRGDGRRGRRRGGPGGPIARPGRHSSTSSCGSTAVRSIPYNG